MPPRRWLVSVAAALIAGGIALLTPETRPWAGMVGLGAGVFCAGVWTGRDDG